jgi:hypothetical protein
VQQRITTSSNSHPIPELSRDDGSNVAIGAISKERSPPGYVSFRNSNKSSPMDVNQLPRTKHLSLRGINETSSFSPPDQHAPAAASGGDTDTNKKLDFNTGAQPGPSTEEVGEAGEGVLNTFRAASEVLCGVARSHLEFVVQKLIESERMRLHAERWTQIIIDLSLRASNSIRPAVHSGDNMDLRAFVKVGPCVCVCASACVCMCVC